MIADGVIFAFPAELACQVLRISAHDACHECGGLFHIFDFLHVRKILADHVFRPVVLIQFQPGSIHVAKIAVRIDKKISGLRILDHRAETLFALMQDLLGMFLLGHILEYRRKPPVFRRKHRNMKMLL